MSKFVSYKQVKEKVTMQMVLDHFGLMDKLKTTSKGLRGCCPIHGGKHENQFFVDLKKNNWNCFGGCQMGKDGLEGHVIGFVVGYKKLGFREAALYLAETFDLSTDHPAHQGKPASAKKTKPGKTLEEPVVGQEVNPEPENKPLTFELKKLSTDHPFFFDKGIIPETVEYFGLGFCSRGMMKDRIVFPLHNHKGELVGYTGRTVEKVTEENPKWLLPPIVKSKVVYNLHRVAGKHDTIILVEGCMDVMALHQSAIHNVGALLGKEVLADEKLSYDQARLLTKHFTHVVLMGDGDQDGKEGMIKSFRRLAGELIVSAVPLPTGKDPYDLTSTEIHRLLSFLRK